MKKATNTKNKGKIIKLHPIMQEHFGNSMNLARIKLMALLLAWIIHTTCYCKEQWLAPERNARSFFLNAGFTTFCVGAAQAHADAQPLSVFATQQCESSRLKYYLYKLYT